MTASVFFADDLNSDLSNIAEGDHVHLGGAEGKHAATVRRMQVGDEFDLVNGEGWRAQCRVRAVNGQELDLVVEHVMCEPASDPHLILVQALAKGGRDEQAIDTSTEIGIDSVIPWQAHRSLGRCDPDRGRCHPGSSGAERPALLNCRPRCHHADTRADDMASRGAY